jgi:hypothetical protein
MCWEAAGRGQNGLAIYGAGGTHYTFCCLSHDVDATRVTRLIYREDDFLWKWRAGGPCTFGGGETILELGLDLGCEVVNVAAQEACSPAKLVGRHD